MQIQPRTRIQLSLLHRPELGSLVVLVAALASLEVLGRRLGSDLGDALVMLLLVMVAAACGFVHSIRRLSWAEWALRRGRRTWARLSGHAFEVGVDLRGTPPIPPAVPVLLTRTIASLLGILTVVVTWMVLVQVPARALLVRIFYLGYVGGLCLLWAGLLAAIALMVYLPAAHIHDLFVSGWKGRGRRPRGREILTLGSYFLVTILAGWLLPRWVPTVLMVVGLLLSVVYVWIPPRRTLNLLWRRRNSPRIHSLDWNTYLVLAHLLLFLPFLLVTIMAQGRAAVGLAPLPSAMPVTATLGSVAAWLSAVGLPFLAGYFAWYGHDMRRLDPERPCPTTVHVAGAEGPHERRRVRELLAPRGWHVRFDPAGATATDVRLRLVDPPMPRPFDRRAGAPLEVSLAALEVPELLDLIARRDEIQRRRVLIRRLRSIFRRAARRRYRSGSGYWVAPQYWFISALSRDRYDESFHADEGTLVLEIIPPFYHHALPRPVRHHLHRVFRALAIDLVFLEDGVGFRGLRRVLRIVFEHYDVHGGRRPIEEMHFRGLQGIRVMIHDYRLDRPLDKKDYPEPDYEDLGRARVLHVFRDRGGPPDDDVEPVDIDRLLMPAGSRR